MDSMIELNDYYIINIIEPVSFVTCKAEKNYKTSTYHVVLMVNKTKLMKM